MKNLYCSIDDISTESDVEQKFIYQLLSKDFPEGCGLSSSDIITKKSIKGMSIGKANKKVFFPDYIVVINGVPLVVIEAKKEEGDLEKGYYEARLYANELNALYPHEINPCKYVIASNGALTKVGYFDSDELLFELSFNDFVVGNELFYKFLDILSKDNLQKYFNSIIRLLRKNQKFYKPVTEVGGTKVQNIELPENDFGRNFTVDYNRLLVPESEKDYCDVVKNAYVKSKNREQHVEPILKTIRNEYERSLDNINLISTSTVNTFLTNIQKQDFKEREDSLILLIGSVGSGKSTFIRYIKNVILPEDDKISENLQWFILDMNKAPLAEDKIYDWIISYVIEELVRFNSLNLNLDFLKCLFEDEVKEFENGIGKLLQGNNSYNVKLYELLESLLHNDQRKLKSLIKYIRKKEKKTCIIIFDNVDKATDESQLLMFQVAEWFRKEFKTLIIMPLRDTTYSKYRNKPPLDTVIKDMVYRIDPPDLLKVLQERLNYIIRLITNDYRQENYALKNGIKVKLNDDERLEYIKAILYSIRGNDLVKHLFYTIADKNIRSGIELFIDFCRSGYLKSDDFFKVRATNGEYIIPNHMMVNAVIRGNRKYYNSGQSKIKNLFSSDYKDDFVDPFIRVDILNWLNENKNKEGTNNARGLHSIKKVMESLVFVGHQSSAIMREINYLVREKLIVCDSVGDKIKEFDSIRLTALGLMHLHLLATPVYLEACSEDIYYNKPEIVKRISDRLKEKDYLKISNVIGNISDMLEYLSLYKNEYLAPKVEVFNGDGFCIYDLNAPYKGLESIKHKPSVKVEELKEKYQPGMQIEVIVTQVIEGGIFVSINFEAEGFIPRFRTFGIEINEFNISDILYANIIKYREDHKRFELEFVNKIA